MRRLLPLLLLVSLAAPAGDPPLPSVDDPPDLAMGAVGDFAVIVGVPTYPFIPARPVAYAQQDAQAIVRFVEESRGVPADRVRLLLGNDATRERMLQVLTEAGTRTGANGVVWLYFAGHGSADPDTGERILLPVDAQEDALSFRAKGVRVDEAVRAASAGGARVVVIADACYTGVGKGRFSVDMDWLPPEASVAELTATKSGEVAMPLDAAKHGAFTFAMLGALRGWADGTGGPKDGVVTMAEATAYTSSALDAMGFDQQDPFPAYAGAMTDQFALVSKGRGVFEAAPVLPRMSGGVVQAPTVPGAAPKPQIAVVGPSATSLSDLDKQLVEQECVAESLKVAEASAAREEASAVAAQQASMRTAWAALKGREAAVLTLPTVEARAPMIAAVEKFLADAKALKVTRSAGAVTVPVVLRPSAMVGRDVDCGTRSVALAGRTTSVPVAEVKDAEAMLVRLKAPPGVPTVATPSRGSVGVAGRRWVGTSGYEMLWVSPGTFLMGSPSTEAGRYGDEQQHQVTLSQGFWVGKSEVTQGVWTAVMGSNPSSFYYCGADCPVEQVSWCDAVWFANALSARDGFSAAYDGVDDCPSDPEGVIWNRAKDGYRLATEAEWEKAALGGQSADYRQQSDLEAIAWYGRNSGGTTHRACTKQANSLGLCDTSGNVWEWTWDHYESFRADPVEDPTGPSSGPKVSDRVIRGGSWGTITQHLRVAGRSTYAAVGRCDYVGLRLVRSSFH